MKQTNKAALRRRRRNLLTTINNIPMMNADIVTGVAMCLFFVAFFGLWSNFATWVNEVQHFIELPTRLTLGFGTLLIAHITFSIPYVILNVLPKLKAANHSTYEAALDLGASPLYAFYKVTWPEIRSGVFSGFLMAVTMSLDDFSITYFTKGAGVNTLSTMLYTELRKGIKPELYALSTILFFTVLILLLAVNYHPTKKTSAEVKRA
jgi:spermidine/putrescine transport system permease protein